MGQENQENQYDKAEELITFYTFAPLELRKKEGASSRNSKIG